MVAQRARPLWASDDVEGVEVLEDRALAEEQQIGVAPGADRRVGAQRPVLARSPRRPPGTLPCRGRALGGAAPPPGGVELEERELDERAPGHDEEVSGLPASGEKSLKPGRGSRYPGSMRIALVSPYSWTYQGGVNRHVEALAEQFLGRGDHVRVLAPWDPPDGFSRRVHRARPRLERPPDYLVPLGRTIGFGANGAVSNLSAFPDGLVRLRRELRAGRFDVVHVHEPPAPLVSWDAATFRGAPVVGTFHAYSTKAIPNHIATLLGARRIFNQLSARIAVSEAAAWTGRRWFGGDYRIIPNGVDIGAAPQGAEARRGPHAPAVRGPRRGAQGPSGPALRLRGAGRAGALPPDRGRGRPRGDLAAGRRPRGRAPGSTRSARSPTRSSGASSARPTCSALPRSPARASAWS